jgi:deoxyribodipyrimidine photolyase-related protein
MQLTAQRFLALLGYTPPEDYDRALVILHDQLNLAVFPEALLAEKPLLIFVESLAYATFIPHHQQKLTYILSAQRHFAIACRQQGYPVHNIFSTDYQATALEQFLNSYPHIHLTYMEPAEWDTRQQMAQLQVKFPRRVWAIANNFFIADLAKYQTKISKGYRLETFYRELRKTTGYLITDGQPAGNQWNFDQDNRRSLPKKIHIPQPPNFQPDPITQEIISLIRDFLPNHFGQLEGFSYAVTRSDALVAAADFIQNRLPNFGPYEDAMCTGEPWLFHSGLSVYLNNGLLLPRELCEMAITAYQAGLAPLNSVEGFVRQILGWREFIRVYYEARMPEARNSNYFGFSNNLPQLYWNARTDLACLRDALSNAINYAYSHHIQRLMVLSNFSNLTLTDPLQLHRWFWLAYADAYEWVELPNVLGMATFADGGILASKPYVAGGNYISKMSNYCRQCRYSVKQKTGTDACPFNYLYWNFVDRHRQAFQENGRVSLMTKMFDAKPEAEKQAIKISSDTFLASLPRDTTT